MGRTSVGTRSVGKGSVGTGVTSTGVFVASGVTGVDAAEVALGPGSGEAWVPAVLDAKDNGVLDGVDVFVGVNVTVSVWVGVGVIEGVRVIVGVPVNPGLSSIYQRSAMAVLVLLMFLSCSGLSGSDTVMKPTI